MGMSQGHPVRSSSDCTYKTCYNDVLFVCIANYTTKNDGEGFDQLNVTIIRRHIYIASLLGTVH